MCVCICACMRAYPHKCHGTCMEVRGQLVGSWFSLPTMWVGHMGMEHKSLGLVANAFTH